MRQERARIISNQVIGEDAFVLRVSSTYLSSESAPGQFFHVRVHEGVDPLLRRPLSLHRRSASERWIEVLYKVKGKGTRILAERKAGEELDIIGPLGTGFPSPEGSVCLIAGGMGVAPFGAVLQDLGDAGGLDRAIVLIGARTADALLCVEEFRELGVRVEVATDDGSLGFAGSVSELLGTLPAADVIFCCGPSGMTRAIVRQALDAEQACFVSVEERMGCGIGMCRGCAIKVGDEGAAEYVRTCKDGPVFSASRLAAWADEG